MDANHRDDEESGDDSPAAGNSPLEDRLLAAAWGGDVAGVREAIRLGARLECFNDLGNTPLHLAVGNDWPEVVRVLLEAGADVDGRMAGGGWTPLYRAVDLACVVATQDGERPDNTLVRLLAGHGADPNAPCDRGETPLELARHYDVNDEAVAILTEAAGRSRRG